MLSFKMLVYLIFVIYKQVHSSKIFFTSSSYYRVMKSYAFFRNQKSWIFLFIESNLDFSLLPMLFHTNFSFWIPYTCQTIKFSNCISFNLIVEHIMESYFMSHMLVFLASSMKNKWVHLQLRLTNLHTLLKLSLTQLKIGWLLADYCE
jgi:hypothetical protein